MKLIAEASAAAQGFRPLILPHHAPKSLFGTGARTANRSGAGEDFFQYREYGFGDDTRQIDWRQSARGDDIFIREHERLLPHLVYLDCDTSPAMQFNSRPGLPTKAYAAQRLLLAAAQLLMQGESKVASLRASSAPVNSNGSTRKNNLTELAHEICTAHDNAIPPLPTLKPHSFLLLASDFRQGAAAWHDFITRASVMGLSGACVQMLDPVEHEFPFYGRVRLESAENDDTAVIPSADIVRPIYLERMAREQTAMEQHCRRHGWFWLSLTTDQAPRVQLSQLLQMLGTPSN